MHANIMHQQIEPSSMSSVETQVLQLEKQHYNGNISQMPGMCLVDIGCVPYNGHRNMINMFTLSTSSLKLQISFLCQNI